MTKTLINDHNKNGVEAANKGDFITAEKEFYKAFNLSPLNQGLLFNFIKILHVQKKYLEIIKFVSKTSKQTKSNWDPSVLFLAGQSAINLNNDTLAQEIFENLNKKNPYNSEFAMPYSQVLLKVGNLKKADEVLNKCLEKNHIDPSLITNLAIIKSENGEYKKAEDLYLKVIKITPNQFLGYYNYSLFLYNQNRFEESLKEINKALEIVPNAPEGLEIKMKLLQRNNSHQVNIDHISETYKAIELRNWELAYQSLSKCKDSEKDAKFIAAITYLPEKYQRRFGYPNQFDPKFLVQKKELISARDERIGRLVKLVKSQSTLVWNRPEKPTIQGYQSHEVFGKSKGEINSILGDKLLEISKEYFYNHLQGDKLSNQINFKISGWSVILLSGGKQLRHIHPDSLVSGVLYLKVPKSVSDSSLDDGNLIFPSFNQLSVVPSVGKVILFPSYLPHETIEFSSNEERICIAFNLMDGSK